MRSSRQTQRKVQKVHSASKARPLGQTHRVSPYSSLLQAFIDALADDE